jgi:glycosyltransferase involved in cell wall biosynthesis
VLASPHSGAARELVEAWDCGLVRPMTVEGWAEVALHLLDDPALRATLRDRAAPALARFSLAAATAAYQTAITAYAR